MLVKRLWKRAFALGGAGLLLGLGCGNAHAATTVLNETFNAATAQTWTDNPAAGAASLSADNTFTVYNGNVSGLNAITDLGSGNLCYEHTSNNARGTGGSANASDFILMKQSGVPAVDIGTIASTNTLLFQYDLTQNATGVATGTTQQGNRQIGLECYQSTATRDGYAVRFAPRNDNTILQVGKISAASAAPPAIAGSNFTALTAANAPAMTNATKTLRIIVMLKPTVNGATTGNTNITYRIVNLTDGTDFIAPATSSIAFGPTAGTTIDHAGLVARQKTLCQVDNAKIVADPAPVLTALGGTVTVAQGGTYTDNAANIGGLDATDGILTTTSSPTAISVDTSAVNTSVVGSYTVTYSATNSLGNTGTTTRTVIVSDQTAPTITLNGANPVTVAQGSTYTDAGVTLSDNVDSPATLAGRLVTVNPVNTAVVGQYTVTYDLTDTANNAAVQVTRTVNVTDQTGPVATSIVPVISGPTNAGAISFTVGFDEAVANFDDVSDVAVSEPGVSHTGVNIAGGPQVYTVTVTGVSGDGLLSLAVNTTSDVQDSAGNALTSSVTSAAVTIDNTSPAPMLSSTSASVVGGAFTVNVDTGESTTDLGETAFSATNGTVSDLTGSGSSYSFTLTPTATPVTVTLNAGTYHDEAGNLNGASNALTRNFDATLPSVVSIVSSVAASTNVGSIVFTVTFSEPVQNVNSASDFVLTLTGTVTSDAPVVATVSASVYTVTVSNIAGDGSLQLAASTASDITDLTSNPLGASPSTVVTIDHTVPVFASIAATPSEAHVGDDVTITFSSTDNIAGDPDVTVNGHPAVRGAKSIFTYTYTVSPSDPLGPATIQIDGVDTAGNAGSSTTSAALTVTVAPPSVPAVNGLGLGVCVLVLVLASATVLRDRKAH